MCWPLHSVTLPARAVQQCWASAWKSHRLTNLAILHSMPQQSADVEGRLGSVLATMCCEAVWDGCAAALDATLRVLYPDKSCHPAQHSKANPHGFQGKSMLKLHAGFFASRVTMIMRG